MPHRRMRPAFAVAATVAMTAGMAGIAGAAHADTAPVVHGVVKDAAGHLVNGWIEVENADTSTNTVGTTYQNYYSIQDGEYAFAIGDGSGQVPAGNYVMDVFDSSGASVSQWYDAGGTQFPIDSNTNASVLDLGTSSMTLSPVTLALYPTVTGSITSAGGNAVQGSVEAIPVVNGTPDDANPQWSQFDSSQSNTLFTDMADGTYLFEVYPNDSRFSTGFYQQGATGNLGTDEASATPVTVTGGTAHLSDMVLTPGPSVRGVVSLPTGTNGWIVNTYLHWFTETNGTWTEAGSTGMNGAWYSPSGTFDTVIPAGTYKFEVTTGACFYSGGWCDGNSDDVFWYHSGSDTGTDVEHATPVTVNSEVNLGALLVPNPATAPSTTPATTGSVSGVVKNASGKGLGGINVEVMEGGNGIASATTSADGTFTVGGLNPATDYVVQASDPANAYVTGWYGGSSADTATPVTVTAGQTTKLGSAITLAPYASISGTVKSASGSALSNIRVDAFDANGNQVSESRTTQAGTYTLTGLAAGSYVVQFTDDQLGQFETEFLGGTTQVLLATPVTVTAGQAATGANIALQSQPESAPVGVDVTGVVTDDTGRRLRGVTVAAVLAGTQSTVEQVTTDANGVYAFTTLDASTPMSYQLDFMPAGEPLDASEFPVGSAWLGDVQSQVLSSTVKVVRGATTTAPKTVLDREGGIRLHVNAQPGKTLSNPFGEMWTGNVVDWEDTSLSVDASGNGSAFVPSGDYRVSADDDNSEMTFWDGASDVATKTKHVSPGQWTDVTVNLQPRFHNLTKPTVSGTPVVGQTLRANPGTWNMAQPETVVTWLRNGKAIGTGLTHKVLAADAGAKLSIQVRASGYDWWNWGNEGVGTATSSATAPATYSSSASVKGASPAKGTVVLAVTVKVAGGTPAGGRLTIKNGAKVVATRVAVTKSGKVTIRLTGQPKGKHTYSVTYAGPAHVTGSSAKAAVTVR